MLYVAGAGVLGLLLLSKTGSAASVSTPASNTYGVIPVSTSTTGTTTVPLSSICPGLVSSVQVPAPPAIFNEAYFMQYQYPPLTAANPNLLNSNYTLSQAELNQYAANYVDVAQGVKTWTSNGGNFNANLQSHWKQYGVAQHRVFVPFLPTDTTPYVAPPAGSSSSGGGGGSSWVGTALTVAGSIVALLGPNDPIPFLTDLDLETVVEGGAIMKDILPLFYQADSRAIDIEGNLDATLNNYLA